MLISLTGACALRGNHFSNIIYLRDIRSIQKQNFGKDPDCLHRLGTIRGLVISSRMSFDHVLQRSSRNKLQNKHGDLPVPVNEDIILG